MSKRFKKKDPFAEREAQKYERPIASRELIMSYLEDLGKSVSFKDIISAFDIRDEEQQIALKRRLRAMERDGQLVRRGKKYSIVVPMELIRGRVIGRRDGYGFVEPETGGEDIFLSPYQMRAVFPDDIVLVRPVGTDRRGRPEGTIVEIIERNTQQIVGRLFHEEGVDFVVPVQKNINLDILIPENHTGTAEVGQFVVVKITKQPSARRQPVGDIIEILGDRREPGMETEVAIRSHGLRHLWPTEVAQEIRKIPQEVSEKEINKHRKDCRHLHFVTIDGEDAKDFDDAVFCQPSDSGGWTLYVAIADVSHYVKPRSALDQEAYLRGNSVYFPSRVIPMLPEALSNEICSLKPKVDRLVMVCQMQISKDGHLHTYDFYSAIICSHARLTYARVARMLENPKTNQNEHLEHLENLHALYKKLYKQRLIRGALNFETTETRIIFDEQDKIRQIVPVVRNDAHKLIEECMLVANVATALFLKKHKMPVLYRVHEGPTNERLERLQDFLRGVGLRLSGGESPTSQDYAKLLERIEGRLDANLIQTVLLRSLAQAIYTPSNSGHFGLAYDAYCHFTSPIRRYPDLLVHRAIRHILEGKPVDKFHYKTEEFFDLGLHCSKTERSADLATRDVVDWLKCHYLLEKVGNSYDGIIVDITSFGAFVELKDLYVQGLLHITALENDYYTYDATHHRLVGQRSGRQYRLGDPVYVQVARVDVDERQVDFVLARKKRK